MSHLMPEGGVKRAARSLLPALLLSLCSIANFGLDWQAGASFRRAAVAPTGAEKRLALLAADETGVRLTNRLSDVALSKNQILEVGSGVALGDVDNDGLVDIYLCGIEGRNGLFRNLGNWRFQDITESAGVACEDLASTGCVLADLDGDDDLDLLVSGIGAGARAFYNDGKGAFKETGVGLKQQAGSTSMALADVNGDGYLDLYVANYNTQTVKDAPEVNVSVRNVGGKLEITPPGKFLPMFGRNGGISLFERGETDHFYLNNGRGGFRAVDWLSGKFVDASGKPLQEAPKEWGLAAMFRDMNRDGAPDLYVCNDFFFSPDEIWLNDGRGNFRMSPAAMVRHVSMSSMAVDFADINRDGLDDFFVLDMMSRDHRTRHRQRGSLVHLKTAVPGTDPTYRPEYPRNTLYLNRGDGTYSEVALLAGVEASEWSWSVSFLDVDLDGYEDLLIANGNLRNANDADASGKGNLRFGKLETANLVYRNGGDLTFREVGSEWGFNQSGISHGMALGDLDNDGDLDVVINNMGAAASLYRNTSTEGRVAVRLKGKAPNTRGIGARVTLKTATLPPQSQEILSGGRYLSSDDGVRTFAAGPTQSSTSIEVRWPDGRRTEVKDVLANSIYEISETNSDNGASPVSSEYDPLFEDISDQLRAVHQEPDYDDWSLQPLLTSALSNLAPGVGWFDADGDGWDDLLVSAGRGSSQLLFINTQTGFRPMKRAETLTRDQTTVLGWRDASGAKLLVGFSSYEDLRTNSVAVREFHLERPGHDQEFPDWNDSVGPLALGIVQGEFRLFVGGHVRPAGFPKRASSRLFKQNASGQWVIDTPSSECLSNIGMVTGAVWSDLDGDGATELILSCDWGPIRVFGTQTGTLVEKTSELGLDKFIGRWNGVATGDLNSDGRPEIVASNWGRNTKYERHRARPVRLYYGDWNDDGRSDLLEAYYEESLGGYAPFTTLDVLREVLPDIATRYTTFAAYANSTVEKILGSLMERSQVIEAVSFETSIFSWTKGRLEHRPLPVLAQVSPAFGISIGDADGDGNEDIFLSQNFFSVDPGTSRYDGGQGLWLLGDGQLGFRAMTPSQSGIALDGEQRGCAVADFDKDGRLDLVVGQHRGPFSLYRNTRAKPGLRVRLQGPPRNPQGIGATVRMRFQSGWSPSKTVQTGSGHWSQNSAVLHFGLPASPVEAQVRWPDGTVTHDPVKSGELEVAIRYK